MPAIKNFEFSLKMCVGRKKRKKERKRKQKRRNNVSEKRKEERQERCDGSDDKAEDSELKGRGFNPQPRQEKQKSRKIE